MKYSKDRQLRFINHETFLSIAWKTFFQVQELCNIIKTRKVITDKDVDQICLCNAEIQRQSITSILFC